MNEQEDIYWMNLALHQATIAASLGEIPIGAVLVQNNKLIAQAHNTRETTHKISGHAEIQVIEIASQQYKTWRFPQATLYVTVEPCLMCAGAIAQAHIQRVVFGAREYKTGALVSTLQIEKIPNLPTIQIQEGVLHQQSEKLMTEFFGGKREK